MSNSGKSVFDMDANVVALLCYLGNLVCSLGLILSIITVIQDKTNKLARFHAWQSIFLSIASLVLIPIYLVVALVIAAIGSIVSSTVAGILGGLASLIIGVIGVAIFVFMVLAAIKAFNGEEYKIPIIGDYAAKYV